MEEANQA